MDATARPFPSCRLCRKLCGMNSMSGAAYPTSCKRRTNMTGQDHAGQRIFAGQYIHADEAAKSRNKIFLRRSTIIALCATLFKYIHIGPICRGPNDYVRASFDYERGAHASLKTSGLTLSPSHSQLTSYNHSRAISCEHRQYNTQWM